MQVEGSGVQSGSTALKAGKPGELGNTEEIRVASD